MLHFFMDRKPWFAAKRFGYGAGLPIAWQGWVLLLSYVAVVAGIAVLAERADQATAAGPGVLIAALTAVFVLIVKARTRGEWRWRWGEVD